MEDQTGSENNEMVVVTKKNYLSINAITMIVAFSWLVSSLVHRFYELMSLKQGLHLDLISDIVIFLVLFLFAAFLPVIGAPRKWKVAKKHLQEVV